HLPAARAAGRRLCRPHCCPNQRPAPHRARVPLALQAGRLCAPFRCPLIRPLSPSLSPTVLDGTTVAVALIDAAATLTVASVGDSEVVLARNVRLPHRLALILGPRSPALTPASM